MINAFRAFLSPKRAEMVRFVKFCVVGTIGTALDFGLFNLFHNILGLHPVPSNTISISAAIVNNYTLSRFWVYPETKHQHGGRKFAQFIVVSLIAWGLNTGILWSADRWVFGMGGLLGAVVARLAESVMIEHGVLASNLAKVIATSIVLFWNFFANRFWTFRDVDDVRQVSEASAA